MSSLKDDSVIVLLGAGASVEADIPHSSKMISEIENSISNGDEGWAHYENLYYYIRSAIFYSEGIHGLFNEAVNYNIEKLVDILNEISERNQHALYPFVGAWNPALVEVAGKEFQLVKEFHDDIVRVLTKDWLAVKDYSTAAHYYEGLLELRRSLDFPLRIFSLNYDLCLEKCASCSDVIVERGFDENRNWDWRLFDHNPDDPKDIYLYKLHGSMDWTYENDQLTYHDDCSGITEPALIFGTSYKLEYRDPFLFLSYEFRRWALESRIIVVIGYGFGDEHINTFIRQALQSDTERILLAVAPGDENRSEERSQEIADSIEFRNSSQIVIAPYYASEFMTSYLTANSLLSHLPAEDNNLFSELSHS